MARDLGISGKTESPRSMYCSIQPGRSGGSLEATCLPGFHNCHAIITVPQKASVLLNHHLPIEIQFTGNLPTSSKKTKVLFSMLEQDAF